MRSSLGVWGADAVGLYFTRGLYRGSGQSYGSVPTTGRTPGLPVVCKGRGDPSPYFGVRCGRFGGGELGSSAVGLKLCISPLGCPGGRFVGPNPSGIVYLGHLYAGESGQFRPLIFLGPVRRFVGPQLSVSVDFELCSVKLRFDSVSMSQSTVNSSDVESQHLLTGRLPK